MIQTPLKRKKIMKTLSAVKQAQFLKFDLQSDDGCRQLWFDLSDNKFKRPLKDGSLKEVVDTGVASFFRKMDVGEVKNSFSDEVYRKLVERVVNHEKKRENSNFATIFRKIHEYMHLESYLLLDIKLTYSRMPFDNPVSQFSKPVIRFMRESGFIFGNRWENAYKKYTKLMTDLCTYIMEKYHDDLLIYKHFYDIVENSMVDKLEILTTPLGEKTKVEDYYLRHEVGFGAEYKSLFDFVIRCIAVEAMNARDVIDEYYDYLKMASKIKQLKHIARLREAGDMTTTINQIGLVDYKKIEKYPRGLTIRHRIVTRNYNVMQQQYDSSKFSAMVDHDYDYEEEEYCVVTPHKPDDIKNEGTELNHCVGSYIESVLQGRTQIMFMRKSDKLHESLVTLEIRSKTIQQARGYGNREVNEMEREWLEKFAKAKNLNYGKVESDGSKPSPTPNPVKVCVPEMVA